MPKDPNVNLMPQHNCQIICVAYYIAPWQWGLNHFYLFYFVEKTYLKYWEYIYNSLTYFEKGIVQFQCKLLFNHKISSWAITRNAEFYLRLFVYHWIHLQHILAAMMLIKEVFLKRLGISPHSFLTMALKCNVRNKLKNS